MTSGYHSPIAPPPRERDAIFKKRSKGEGLEVFSVKGRRGLVEKSLSKFNWAGILNIFS